MIGEVPKGRWKNHRRVIHHRPNLPHIDPKDYVFSEETVRSLTELALLLNEIEMEEEAERALADKSTHHESNQATGKEPPS